MGIWIENPKDPYSPKFMVFNGAAGTLVTTAYAKAKEMFIARKRDDMDRLNMSYLIFPTRNVSSQLHADFGQ